MPKTTKPNGRGKAGPRRAAQRRPRLAPKWDAVDAALRRAGLLTSLPVRGPEATDAIAPIVIAGELVSETIIRERR